MTRVARLLPVIAFVATFGFFLVDKRREASTVLGSGRGLAVIVAIVFGYLALATVVRKIVRWPVATSLIMTVAVLATAAWTVLPYYVDTTVNRTVVSGPIVSATTTTAPLGGTSATTPTDVTTTTVTSAPAPVATRLSTGGLRGIDHEARGRVSLIRSAEGKLVIRFEDFAVEGAPDPVLYLARGENVQPAGGGQARSSARQSQRPLGCTRRGSCGRGRRTGLDRLDLVRAVRGADRERFAERVQSSSAGSRSLRRTR